MSSIRRRLILILVLATGAIWLSALGWIQYTTQKEVTHVLDRRLEEAAHMVASLIRDGNVSIGVASNAVRQAPAEEDEEYHLVRQLSCQVWGLDGYLIGDSEGAPQQELSPAAAGFSENMVEGELWRVFTLVDPDLGVRVLVGDALAMRDHLVHGVVMGLLVPALLVLPALALLIWWAVGHGLQPLDRIGRVMAARPPSDLSPIDASRAPKEVQPMIDALNGLLRRVGGARERERSFTAFAAHELKTPLAGLRTQAEIARMAPDAATRQKALDQLSGAVERTDRMVKQLLEMTAVEHARPTPETRLRDSAEILRATVADLQPLAQKRGVRLEGQADAGLWQTGCAPLLQAALRNLIENALIAAPAGSAVEVAMIPEDKHILFRIADRGPGIAEADRPHVMERFFRAAGAKGSGSGLGLAIVAAAMDRMEGEIRLSPRPGGGELAELILPRAPRPGCG
ncbi:ATP-binding protein [Pseudodonghicola flavimaris]|uniref:histidine kinase n=1 Tax=Pseudodonghicola flavimaris TaxID=3050036 RepID=A0ABT7F2V1_9RHOB|nr:ATP-binding protein [Pseudodonghicola flavimaris]MDK3018900.1 ATP-binding protein [Pseudodonghicola flavimaris]